MLENVLLSNTEVHPINSGTLTINPMKKSVLIVFGLAKRRGENIVSVTRFTDDVATVLTRYGLTLYQIPSTDAVIPQEPAREGFAERGIRCDFVGIAWNIRRGATAWTSDKYTTFLSELSEALGGE